MNVKEQETQLKNDLNTRIIVTILIWAILVAFAIYRLYVVSQPPPIQPIISARVTAIETENLTILRTSVKTPPDQTTRLTIRRAEPFD